MLNVHERVQTYMTNVDDVVTHHNLFLEHVSGTSEDIHCTGQSLNHCPTQYDIMMWVEIHITRNSLAYERRNTNQYGQHKCGLNRTVTVIPC